MTGPHSQKRGSMEDNTNIPAQMVEFANRITPPNWNIFTAYHGRFNYAPNTLNVWLELLTEEQADDLDEEFIAQVRGAMWFSDLEPMGKGKGFIAKIDMQMNPFFFDVWQEAMAHELAHVAVTRLSARSMPRSLRFGIAQNVEPEMHGPLFLKAFRCMILRAKAAYGKELDVKDMWFSYCMYVDGLKQKDSVKKKLFGLAPKKAYQQWYQGKQNLGIDS